MANKAPQYSKIVPKPVHPTAVRFHGLFGPTYVSRHFMSDNLWSPNSLMETFKGMEEVLLRHRRYQKIDSRANRKGIIQECRKLKRQIRNGRAKLRNELSGNIARKIRNYLINHKALERLYQRMPLHMVADNINTRTFVLRKERDRWGYRLRQLRAIYEDKLMIRSDLENRINYQNEFMLEEELKSLKLPDRIQKSKIRLAGIKSINSTYKKMLDVLRKDEIFYEPILRSVSKDYEDLAAFIKYVLYLGMPAIRKFKEISSEYTKITENVRKDMAEKLAPFQKTNKQKTAMPDVRIGPLNDNKRYVHETMSMKCLQTQLEGIESTIRKIGTITLCSQAREILPRVKSLMENNEKLHKLIENEKLGHYNLDVKQQKAELLEGLLISNQTADEVHRHKTIKKLREQIALEDEFEKTTIEHLKNRSDVYVLLRFTLWNLIEILRHIDVNHSAKKTSFNYCNSYLQLPLLKFEMASSRSVPPVLLNENVDILLRLIKRKVDKLMTAYQAGEKSGSNIKIYREAYAKAFLDYNQTEEVIQLGVKKQSEPARLSADVKVMVKILDHPAVKAISRKMVEDNLKKED